MCGRYTLTKPLKTIKKHFDPVTIKCEHRKRYNIAPGQNTPIITLQNDQRELKLMHWGLVPSWAKTIKTSKATINARSETVHQKPSFRDSFQARRCLVPADGFIEWKVEEKEKTPHFISLKTKNIFAFAGIWANWYKDGSPFYSYCILTIRANTTLAKIHQRMPVIIEPSSYQSWLTSEAKDQSLRDLFSPLSADKMAAHQISKNINSYQNDHNGLLDPLSFN